VSADDPILYGEGQNIPILSEEGMSTQFIPDSIILSNEFEMAVAKPGELDEAQDRAAWLITFKGRANMSKGMAAVTIVCDTDMITALIKSMRAKLVQIPIAHR